MLMHPQTALLVGIFAPLVTAILVPFLAVRSNWRDIAGPVGAIVTFVAALDVARAVLGGGTPSWTAVELAPGIELGFRVTPLGAIFGLVASGLWILAAIYSVGYMRAIMKSTRPVLPPSMRSRCTPPWRSPGRATCLCCLYSTRF